MAEGHHHHWIGSESEHPGIGVY